MRSVHNSRVGRNMHTRRSRRPSVPLRRMVGFLLFNLQVRNRPGEVHQGNIMRGKTRLIDRLTVSESRMQPLVVAVRTVSVEPITRIPLMILYTGPIEK